MNKKKNVSEPKRERNRPVQVRLTPQQHELIDMMVKAGLAKNKAHFCLKAIENELAKIKILDVLNVVNTLKKSSETEITKQEEN